MIRYRKIISVLFILSIISGCAKTKSEEIIKPEPNVIESTEQSTEQSTGRSTEQSLKTIPSDVQEYIYMENPSNKILEENDDYVGWLQIDHTVINEPLVKGEDNIFYLDHDFNKEKDKYGTVFMDYRNSGFEFSKNTILYGHNAKNELRFGTIKEYKNEAFALKASIIKVQTLYETYEYDVFAFYFDQARPESIQTNFTSSAPFSRYIADVTAKSMHDFDVLVDPSDQILTLVTCSYDVDDGRYFIHARKR